MTRLLPTLQGDKIYLRPLTVADVTEVYAGWLNDPEINQFLETRFSQHTLQSQREYVQKISKDPAYAFFAIVRKDTGAHVGNIKLGPIDPHHHVGSIGLMIGDRSSWGKGFATEAIQLLTQHSFEVLKVHKLTAGAYENNPASIKVFLKLGFFEEGRRKKHVRFGDDYVDYLLLAKLNPHHES